MVGIVRRRHGEYELASSVGCWQRPSESLILADTLVQAAQRRAKHHQEPTIAELDGTGFVAWPHAAVTVLVPNHDVLRAPLPSGTLVVRKVHLTRVNLRTVSMALCFETLPLEDAVSTGVPQFWETCRADKIAWAKLSGPTGVGRVRRDSCSRSHRAG